MRSASFPSLQWTVPTLHGDPAAQDVKGYMESWRPTAGAGAAN